MNAENTVSKNELQNNVPAGDQLERLSPVRLFPQGGKRRVLFIGNSITWHAPRPQIGWSGDWGMAASAEEKDYVHRLMAALTARYGTLDYGIAQLAEWECTYPDGGHLLAEQFEEARAFCPDLVILRIGENIPKNSAPGCRAYFEEMLDFLVPVGADVVVTDSFWRNDARDRMLCELAADRGYAFCRISDLEADERTMAKGLFEHRGVSIHPGDLGMERIADRLIDVIQTVWKEN